MTEISNFGKKWYISETSEAELTCHLSNYFRAVIVVDDDDNDDAFDYVVVLHKLWIFMKPTLNLKCSGSYGIYLVHC